VKALVLVGGFGTRLRPLTYSTPKQMLPIAGRPMIEWVIGRLAGRGVDEVILSLGYKPDAFLAAYPDGRIAGLPFRVAVEPEPRGTAGAIRFTADELGGLDETFLVLNGDVLTDLDVGALVDFHRSKGGEATIALQPVDDPSRFGVVPTDGTGRVEAFVEKPPPGTAPTNNINAGTYVLEPSVLDRIPAGREVSIERETFPALVDDRALYAMAADCYWLDTGTPEQFLEANLDVVTGRRAATSGSAVAGSVEPGAVVADSVVGAGSTVASGAVVERSVLFDGCVVEADATVVDSVLGVGVRVGAGASVTGMTVIGDGEIVPAGARLVGVRQPPAE
jgi:mannose-1-phosphate guanylyltransferase